MSLGPLEIILIVAVIALIFGAKKLPELGKGVGQGIREFRKEIKDERAVTDERTVTGEHTVTDVPSRRLDPVTGQPVVSEPAVQPPGERR